MRAVDLVIGISWAAFWVYWIAAAIAVKPGQSRWSRHAGGRVAIIVVIIFLPYWRVRHPIYSGLILAVLGTALATTLYGLIAVAVLGGFFIYSATREEAYLTAQFPDAYPAYKQSTKMLIPFVF